MDVNAARKRTVNINPVVTGVVSPNRRKFRHEVTQHFRINLFNTDFRAGFNRHNY